MLKLLAVGLGGFVGAIARYGLSSLIHRLWGGGFPTGTLVVNLAGCLVIGALMALIQHRSGFTPEVQLLWTVGLLGSFTTFSTVAFDTFEILRAGAVTVALANLGANVILGVLAVGLGRWTVQTCF